MGVFCGTRLNVSQAKSEGYRRRDGREGYVRASVAAGGDTAAALEPREHDLDPVAALAVFDGRAAPVSTDRMAGFSGYARPLR